MDNIRVRRIEGDPEVQGVVEPDSERWQLVIDKEGYPHLYIQVNVEDDDGDMTKGMFCLDYLLGSGDYQPTIKELMEEGSFGGTLSGEAKEEALREHLADKKRPPCPR